MKHLCLLTLICSLFGLSFAGAQVSATIDTTAYDAFVKQIQATSTDLATAQAAQVKAAQEQASKTQLLNLLIQSCPFFHKQSSQPLAGADKPARKVAKSVTDVVMEAREEEGYIYEKDLDQDISRTIGHDANEKLAEGCNHFMNAEGKMGSWGSWALKLIKDKPKSFGENVPDDITKWCPNYPKMSKAQRDLFWVWGMMSMASTESSCKPTNDNPNAPNGTALGLFQLEPRVCPKATDLHNPIQNITCAVDLLANELGSRDNLMTPTSKGTTGTYWGPLRNDDNNPGRGGDIEGAKKTRTLMRGYRYCKGDLKAVIPATAAADSKKTEGGKANSDKTETSDTKEASTDDTDKTKKKTEKAPSGTKKATKKKKTPLPTGVWI